MLSAVKDAPPLEDGVASSVLQLIGRTTLHTLAAIAPQDFEFDLGGDCSSPLRAVVEKALLRRVRNLLYGSQLELETGPTVASEAGYQ